MKDIVLNDEAMRTAAQQLADIAAGGSALRQELEDALAQLAEGFDTPAGRKLMQSTQQQVLQPLEDQSAMLAHIAEVLQAAKAGYQPVFDDYEALNRKLERRGL